jgi:chemotaxis protein MotB
MSKIDQSRYEQLAVSLSQSFYEGSSGVMATRFEQPAGQPNESGKSVDKQNLEAARKMAEENERLKQAAEKLKQFVQQNGLSDKVMVELNERGVQITLRDVAIYDTGSAELKQDATRVLMGIAPFLQNLPNKISVEGHTDNVPIHTAQFRSNFELSTERAVNVLHFFQEHNVPGDKMSATGFGEYSSIGDNNSVEGRASNRRVNVIILRNPVK